MIRYVLPLLLGLHVFASEVNAEQESLVRNVARASGFGAFHTVKRLTYTFHVQKGGKSIQRTWRWEPKSGRVSFRENDKKPWFSYTRNAQQLKHSKRIQQIDKRFINDRYWLLFPFHLVWDQGTTISTKTLKKPVVWGKKTLQPRYLLTIRYPKQGGYTPGDMYKLYISASFTVIGWSFHRGGKPVANLLTTWEMYKSFAPIKLSLLRRGVGTHFRVWFTDVSVEK